MGRQSKLLHVLPIAIGVPDGGGDAVPCVTCPASDARVAATDCASCASCMHLSRPGDVASWILVCSGAPKLDTRARVAPTPRRGTR